MIVRKVLILGSIQIVFLCKDLDGWLHIGNMVWQFISRRGRGWPEQALLCLEQVRHKVTISIGESIGKIDGASMLLWLEGV